MQVWNSRNWWGKKWQVSISQCTPLTPNRLLWMKVRIVSKSKVFDILKTYYISVAIGCSGVALPSSSHPINEIPQVSDVDEDEEECVPPMKKLKVIEDDAMESTEGTTTYCRDSTPNRECEFPCFIKPYVYLSRL